MTWRKLNWIIVVCGILSMAYSVFRGSQSVAGGWVSIISAIFFDTPLFDTDLFLIDLHAGGMMALNNLFYYQVAYTAVIGVLFILLAVVGMKKKQGRVYMAIHMAGAMFLLVLAAFWSYATLAVVHLIACTIALLIYCIIGVRRFMKAGNSNL